MIAIAKDSDCITLINAFTVDPAYQNHLVSILSEVTEKVVRHAKGFISTSLHRSLDDYEVMRRDPAPLPYFLKPLSLSNFDPSVYEVVTTYETPAAP